PVTVLIDGGSKGNFISSKIIKQAKIPQLSPSKHTITMADGSTCKAYEQKGLPVEIQQYSAHIDMMVAPIAHDVILGKPWLESLNPTIDWKENTLSFVNFDGMLHQWMSNEHPDRQLFLSATQFKKCLRRKDCRIWICHVSQQGEITDLAVKHLKD